MKAENWPQAFVWAACAAAAAYAISQMSGCAQHMTNGDDVKVECAKQHGEMSWGECSFPNERK